MDSYTAAGTGTHMRRVGRQQRRPAPHTGHALHAVKDMTPWQSRVCLQVRWRSVLIHRDRPKLRAHIVQLIGSVDWPLVINDSTECFLIVAQRSGERAETNADLDREGKYPTVQDYRAGRDPLQNDGDENNRFSYIMCAGLAWA